VKLADFILSDLEAILAEWEAFAATLLPASEGMNSRALRDHAPHILQAVAADLSTAQSPQQQIDKSKGLAPEPSRVRETAAQTHAVLRAQVGFDIRQLAAEYRALRASVLRLWAARFPASHDADFEDVIRFNEAIDQALAESINSFALQTEQARNLMLGMLGHDMRTPLQAIMMAAAYLERLNAGATVSDTAQRVMRSGSRMTTLLDELLDFSRIQLGQGLHIAPAPADMSAVVRDVLAELKLAYPARQIEFQTCADIAGEWDAARLHQLLGNLIVNALKHGDSEMPVWVRLSSEPTAVQVEVRNRGAVIAAPLLAEVFQPLRRGPVRSDGLSKDSGLGLGLYIASEIAKGHGGRIDARSDESETVFTVWLPRVKRAPSSA
jgi:signal transduction histidine kinase